MTASTSCIRSKTLRARCSIASRSSSNPGDVVLDPFCGCGTTVAVAETLGRPWIGIDISPTAMEIMKRRLWNQSKVTPVLVNMPETEDALRSLKPFEFQNWAIMENGAWDYPADTRGYTLGGVVELNQPNWTLRYGAFAEPKQANGSTLDDVTTW